jgi:hypothetical protein
MMENRFFGCGFNSYISYPFLSGSYKISYSYDGIG